MGSGGGGAAHGAAADWLPPCDWLWHNRPLNCAFRADRPPPAAPEADGCRAGARRAADAAGAAKIVQCVLDDLPVARPVLPTWSRATRQSKFVCVALAAAAWVLKVTGGVRQWCSRSHALILTSKPKTAVTIWQLAAAPPLAGTCSTRPCNDIRLEHRSQTIVLSTCESCQRLQACSRPKHPTRLTEPPAPLLLSALLLLSAQSCNNAWAACIQAAAACPASGP